MHGPGKSEHNDFVHWGGASEGLPQLHVTCCVFPDSTWEWASNMLIHIRHSSFGFFRWNQVNNSVLDGEFMLSVIKAYFWPTWKRKIPQCFVEKDITELQLCLAQRGAQRGLL